MYRDIRNIILSILVLWLSGCGGGDTASEFAIKKVYEDAEGGSAARWERYDTCPYEAEIVPGGADGSGHSVYLRQHWVKQADGSYSNEAGYKLLNGDGSYWHDRLRTILDFDKKKEISPDEMLYCFDCGVELNTTAGPRRLVFSTWFDKNHYPPLKTTFPKIVEYTFPLSMEYVNHPDIWQHLHFDLSAYLHRFEPDAEITEVNCFFFEGGDDYLDNISLSRPSS